MTQTAIPAGLGETLGFAAETTVGTYVAPARWIPHKKAELKLKKTTAQSEALQGQRFKQSTRRVLTELSVEGSIELELADKQFGLILAACLGSTASPVTNGTLKTQYHVPNYLEGQALSMQKGVPTTAGAYQAFSYAGTKVKDWTISCQRGQIATIALTTDGWSEATGTGLTAQTYLTGASSPNLLHFASGTLTTGGTVSTTSGVTSVSAPVTPVGLVSKFSVKGVNTLADDRYQIGSTTKQEQLTNGWSEISGDLELEFANLTDFYTAFAADTTTALELQLTSPTTGGTGSMTNAGLYIIIPGIKFEGETPSASGPGVIRVGVPFTGLLDSSGTNPAIQLAYVSSDTAV